MKTAICYYSRHHGNTQKVLEAMAEENDVSLIDVTSREAVHLELYDAVGFASGIYYGNFQKAVPMFLRQYLPAGKPVFFVYTCGAMRGGYTAEMESAAAEREAPVLGVYGCKGYDTFGPFRLVGGIAKGHPNAGDLQKAQAFYRDCESRFHDLVEK